MAGPPIRPYAQQLTALLQMSLDFARHMIETAGEFYPFGGTLGLDLKPAMLAVYNGEEHPDRTAIYQLLENGLTRDVAAGMHRAVAITADVNIPPEYEAPFSDGIRVYLEAPGFCRFIYLPYRRTGGHTEFGELFAVELPNRLFGEDLPAPV